MKVPGTHTLKVVLMGAALISLQACTNTPLAGPDSIADAYSTSGIVAIKPYNRTIFSPSNF